MSGKKGYFPTKDMQTPNPPRSGQIYMKDAECAETNEKRIQFFFGNISKLKLLDLRRYSGPLLVFDLLVYIYSYI